MNIEQAKTVVQTFSSLQRYLKAKFDNREIFSAKSKHVLSPVRIDKEHGFSIDNDYANTHFSKI